MKADKPIRPGNRDTRLPSYNVPPLPDAVREAGRLSKSRANVTCAHIGAYVTDDYSWKKKGDPDEKEQTE